MKRFVFLAIVVLLQLSTGIADTATDPTTLPPSSSTDSSSTSTTTTTTTTSTTTTSTTTTQEPTPPPPTPAPKPTLNTYMVNLTADTYCLMLQAKMSLDVAYTGADKKNVTTTINLGSTAVVDTAKSKCGDAEIVVALKIGQDSSLVFTVSKNTTAKTVYISSISAVASKKDADKLPEDKTDELTGLVQYSVKDDHYYSCTTESDIPLASATITVKIQSIILEAFVKSKENKRTLTETKCPLPDLPDIVPIAVGCALGVLIIVVLIAYVIGRRRNQQRGYQSM